MFRHSTLDCLFLFIAFIFLGGTSSPAPTGECPTDLSTTTQTICFLAEHPLLDNSNALIMGACPYRPMDEVNPVNAGVNMAGARVAKQSTAPNPLDKWHKCRFVDNSSPNDYFVPFRTSKEWLGFLANPPQGANLTHCACPFSGINETAGLQYGPTSAKPDKGDTPSSTFPVSLPYARTGSHIKLPDHTFKHTCYEHKWEFVCSLLAEDDSRECLCSGWVCAVYPHTWEETFSFEATALDSDAFTPSWVGVSKKVSGGTRPPICETQCINDGMHNSTVDYKSPKCGGYY